MIMIMIMIMMMMMMMMMMKKKKKKKSSPIIHPFKGHHVAEGVGSLRKWANRDLALARGVISARPGLPRAAASGVDIGTIVCSAVEVVAALRVRVGAAGGGVQRHQHSVTLTHGGGSLGVLEIEVGGNNCK